MCKCRGEVERSGGGERWSGVVEGKGGAELNGDECLVCCMKSKLVFSFSGCYVRIPLKWPVTCRAATIRPIKPNHLSYL